MVGTSNQSVPGIAIDIMMVQMIGDGGICYAKTSKTSKTSKTLELP